MVCGEKMAEVRDHSSFEISTSPSASTPTDEIEVIDTHQHMWFPSVWSCPWLSDPSCAALNRNFGMSEYLRAVQGCNVKKTIFLETDAVKEDLDVEARAVLDLCLEPDTLLSGCVLGADIASPDFIAYITKYQNNAHVKGVRQVLHTLSKGYCLQEMVIQNVKYLGTQGLSFEALSQPDQLDDILVLAQTCPGTVFILNHCGGHQGLSGTCPPLGEMIPAQHAAWEKGIRALAALDNVVAKVSGVYGGWSGGMQDWHLGRQLPTMTHVMDCFPATHIMFGSDWPVCEPTCPVAQFINDTKAFVLKTRGLSYARDLFYNNAVRWYKLDRHA